MKKNSPMVALVAVAVVIAIIGLIVSYAKHHIADPGAALSVNAKNATYIVEGTEVKLTDGVSQVPAAPGSASMITTKYFGNEAVGDLNSDGTNDDAFLLTQDSGGSGTFYYVAVALSTPGGYKGTNAVVLGDRIAPQGTAIVNGQAVVNYVVRKATDPMTTPPSVAVSKFFEVKSGALVEVPNTLPTGSTTGNTQPVACTMEAKMCPDGSYVGRSGPKCEFAACPTPVPSTPPLTGFNAPVKFSVGQTVSFTDGLKVELKTISDSRCKPNVQCIWAGEVSGTFDVYGGPAGTVHHEMMIGTVTRHTATLGGHTFTAQDGTADTMTVLVQ